MQDLQRFAGLVSRAMAGGQPMTGATLGTAIRRIEPSFRPQDYGAERLIELLQSCPELGTVVRRGVGEDVLFVPAGAELPPSVVSGAGPKARAGGTTRRAFLRPELWQALVNPASDTHAWVDLGSARLELRSAAQPPHDDADPHRFLRVPPIDQSTMQAWAADFILSYVTPSDPALELLRGSTWFRDLSEFLNPTPLLQQWQVLHREKVQACWDQWATEHEIEPRRGYVRQTEKTAKVSHGGFPARGNSTVAPGSDVRAILHRALDLMSEDELLSLQLPLRYILRAQSG